MSDAALVGPAKFFGIFIGGVSLLGCALPFVSARSRSPRDRSAMSASVGKVEEASSGMSVSGT